MCRGLALGLTKDLKVICKGISSHTDTFKKAKVDEDKVLKFELIIDDSKKEDYSLELDEEYKNDEVVLDLFKEHFTKSKRLKKASFDFVMSWIKHNEVKVLKWLLSNRNSAKQKGNCDNSYQEVKGNCNNSCQKVEGNCYNYFQDVEGNCSNSSQKVEGNCNNSCQKVEGNCSNSGQEVKGEIFINNVKNFDEKTDDFIKKLTEEENYNLTWKKLVRLAIKGYKEKGK